VIDGMPFSRAGELEAVEDIASNLNAVVHSFLLECPVSVAMERVARSQVQGSTLHGYPSTMDRTPHLVMEVANRFRSFPLRTLTLDATEPTELLGMTVMEVLYRFTRKDK
jgi:hypothetical protein